MEPESEIINEEKSTDSATELDSNSTASEDNISQENLVITPVDVDTQVDKFIEITSSEPERSTTEIVTLDQNQFNNDEPPMDFKDKIHMSVELNRVVKLNRIMNLFKFHKNLTNQVVMRTLHISKSSAGRYLHILLNSGQIKFNGFKATRLSKGKEKSYIRM